MPWFIIEKTNMVTKEKVAELIYEDGETHIALTMDQALELVQSLSNARQEIPKKPAPPPVQTIPLIKDPRAKPQTPEGADLWAPHSEDEL